MSNNSSAAAAASRSSSTSSSSSSSSAVVVAAVSAALAGVAVGLVLPGLCRRLVRSSSLSSIRGKDNNNNNKKSINAVRAGLNDDDNDGTSVRLDRDRLDDLVARILVAAGCREDGARLTARVLSYADSRGIPSHGANRVDAYVNEIRAGWVHPRAIPAVEKCSGCCAVIHGHNGLGTVTSKLAMETALRLAGEHGAAVVTCHSSNHYGAAGFWAQMALDRGLLGFSFTNTSPIAVPTRSRARGLGTNPFCFMAPAATATRSENDDSFQLDMATTTVPIGKIEVMDRIGKPVPLGWGVDRHGRDCSDGAEICKFGGLYPLGGAEETAGYKGYGLGMFVEILCSVLSGAAVGPDVPPWTIARDGPLNYGHCFIVIDQARFTPGFEDRLGRYLDRMRNLPGVDVLVAGDPEKAYEHDAAKKGILLHGPVATTLKALAKRYNVTVPPELECLDESKSKASLYE